MQIDDIERFKAEIKAEVIKEITGKDYKAANSKTGVFDEVRDKYKKPLRDTFGICVWSEVWDNIRRLSCRIAGVRYVRDLTPSMEFKAAEIAETLCKMALESREDKHEN
jgi:hypothetical protein